MQTKSESLMENFPKKKFKSGKQEFVCIKKVSLHRLYAVQLGYNELGYNELCYGLG